MKINLLFDLSSTQPYSQVKRHGGGIYGEIVFTSMVEKGYRFNAVYDSNRWLNPEIMKLCKENDMTLYDLAVEKIDAIVERNHLPLIYCPISSLSSDKTESIKTLHGLRRIEMPNDWMQLHYQNDIRSFVSFFSRIMFPRYWRKRYEIRVLNLINRENFKFVTVSNHSKYSILSTFPFLKEDSVKVFYSPCPNVDINKVVPYQGHGKYFLLVSGNRWEKNNLRALMALDELFSEQERFKDYYAVVTGVDDLSFFKYKFKNPQKFECKGYVEDDVLRSLHAGSYAFVYPSLNEGFGYPPLDAMGYGKPVLASAITSIPEVCGDAVLYFNPLDYKEIKNRLLMVTDTECYHTLSQKSVERYKYIHSKQNEDLEGLIKWIVAECEQHCAKYDFTQKESSVSH
jgi:glycosyltransferase involved in cell wall biosynthesis